MDTLEIAGKLSIPMSEIEISAVRSRGAGGQNVNKVATAIHLRFDGQRSESIPDAVKQRLLQIRDHRITDDGVIVIKSQAHRSQERNKQAALSRLGELLGRALQVPKRRIPTRPGRKARQKRLTDKSRRSAVKKNRGRVTSE